MKRRIRPLLIGLAAALMLALLATYLLPLATQGAFGHAATRITFAYPGAEQGLAPGGGTLDVQALRSDEVLAVALQTGDYGDLDVETLRQHLLILPVLNTDPTRGIIYGTQPGPGNTSQASPAQVRPMSYNITLRAGLPGNEQTLLEAVVQAYLALLRQQYSITPALAFACLSEPEPDYRESVLALMARAAILETRASRYANGVSPLTDRGAGQSFTDIRAEAAAMRSATLQKLLDEIDTYALSQDPKARLAYDEALLEQQRTALSGLENGAAFVLAELGVQPAAVERVEPEETGDDTNAETLGEGSSNPADEQFDENPEEQPGSSELTTPSIPPVPAATGGRAAHLLERYLEETQAITELKDSLARTENRLATLRQGRTAGNAYAERSGKAEADVARAASALSTMEERLAATAQEHFDAEYRDDILVSDTRLVRYRFGNVIVNFVVLAGAWVLVWLGIGALVRSKKFVAVLKWVIAHVKKKMPAERNADDGH